LIRLNSNFGKILFSILLFCFLIVFIPQIWIFFSSKNKIFSLEKFDKKEKVIIVFGAGVRGNKVSSVAADRLKTAFEIYNRGLADKILVSGDNSHLSYNEPIVMKNYIVSLGVKDEDVALDYAGFRTFDTCFRANRVFGLNSAILVTQSSHLPRAIFLCNSFGVSSVGVSADLQKYRNWNYQFFREFFAKTIAFYEVFIFRHEPKFLGEKIEI